MPLGITEEARRSAGSSASGQTRGEKWAVAPLGQRADRHSRDDVNPGFTNPGLSVHYIIRG